MEDGDRDTNVVHGGPEAESTGRKQEGNDYGFYLDVPCVPKDVVSGGQWIVVRDSQVTCC